jgi:hypothetical protein
MAGARQGVDLRELEEARERLMRALEPSGVLLIHDTALPSATSIIAGHSIRGSWWGNLKGNLIYAVLEGLGTGDVDFCKLIKGKDTLVVRRLWPALAAMGLSRATWQLAGLGPAGRWVWEQATTRGQVSQRELAEARAIPGLGAVMTDLQKRLLVHGRSEHTELGQHQKSLQSWPAWLALRQLEASSLPDVETAAAAFGEAARGLGPDPETLFPWGKLGARASTKGKRAPSHR